MTSFDSLEPNRKKPATIRQVAEMAGVSIATVSRVLAGADVVSDELAERVQNAARLLDYHPNHIARSFRTQKTRLVALVVSDIENPFFTSIVRGIEKNLRAAGYSLLLTNSDEDEQIEWEHLQNLRAEGVAGVIIAPTSRDFAKYEGLIESGMALVAIDRVPSNLKIDRVTVNNIDGSRYAVQHLIAQGHQKIGFIAGPQRISTAFEREIGYEQEMRAAGLTIQPEWIQPGDYRRESGFTAMQNILAMTDRPTAVISANNLMTLGALQAIYECGVRIPDQMALVGFDDMVWASSLNPPLTAIAQPALELGNVAAQLLLERLKYPDRPFRHVMLDTELVVRTSSGAHKD